MPTNWHTGIPVTNRIAYPIRDRKPGQTRPQACIGYAPCGSTLGTPNWGSEITLYDLITAKIDMYLNRIFESLFLAINWTRNFINFICINLNPERKFWKKQRILNRINQKKKRKIYEQRQTAKNDHFSVQTISLSHII